MRKKLGTKIVAGICMAFLLISTVGCGKQQEDESENTADLTYAGERMSPEGMEGVPDLCCAYDDTLYVVTNAEAENGEEPHFYQIDPDTGTCKEIAADISDAVASVSASECALTIVTVSDTESGNASALTKIPLDGGTTEEIQLTETLRSSAEVAHVNALEIDDGTTILVEENGAYLLDENGQLSGQVPASNGCRIVDAARTKDGEILVVEQDETDTRIVLQAKKLLLSKQSWEDLPDVDVNDCPGGDYISDGGTYDFYYRDDAGIYGYRMEMKQSEQVMDYGVSDLTSEDAAGMTAVGEERFAAVMKDYASETQDNCLMVYRKADSDDAVQRTTITVAAFYMQNENLRREIARYNRSHPDYQIVVKEYAKEEDPVTAINKDLVAGDKIDIIDLSNFPFSAEQCVNRNLLEDLTPYYESDEETKSSNLVPALSDAMQIQGKYYYVASCFAVNTLAGKKEMLGERTGWNYDEMLGLLNEMGSDGKLFYDEDSSSASDMLFVLLYNGLSDFVDWEGGTCDFEGTEFRSILTLCKERGAQTETSMSEDEIKETVDAIPDMFRKNQVLLDLSDYTSLESVPIEKQIIGDEVVYVGYPNEEEQGSYFRLNDQLGIFSGSEHKEQAWELLRTFLTQGYQAELISSELSPTRQDCLDLQIEAKMATQSYTNAYGQEIEPLSGTWMYGDVEMEKKPLNQSDVDTYMELVRSTKKIYGYDEEIMDIILSETESYFHGENDLDGVCEVIQNRITTYVNEQK